MLPRVLPPRRPGRGYDPRVTSPAPPKEIDANQWLRLAETRDVDAKAADAAGRSDDFSKHVGRLREQYRRRPTLIAMLEKAGFR